MTATDGFDAFFAKEYPAVARTIFLMVGDRAAAEDVAQEAFARAFARWTRLRGYDKPGAWVRRVAIRIAGRVRPPITPDVPAARSMDESLDLRTAIHSLPAAQRVAVVLHYYEDLPVEECARLMRCAAATVRVHLHRARKRLADLLLEVPDVTG